MSWDKTKTDVFKKCPLILCRKKKKDYSLKGYITETATKQRASRNGAELIHWGPEYFKGVAFILSPTFSALRKGYEREEGWIKPCPLFCPRPQLPPQPAFSWEVQNSKQKTGQQIDIFITILWRTQGQMGTSYFICVLLYKSKVML